MQRILAKKQSQSFNSLEITKTISKRLLGVSYLTISAHFRHIQEGMYLIPVKDFQLRDTAGITAAPIAAIVFGNVEKVPQE